MKVLMLPLLLSLCASAQTAPRPSYLHNRHSSNLTWQTRATTFTGATVTKTGTAVHWDFGDGTAANNNAPTKVYPDTGLKTFYMIARDGWGGLTVLTIPGKSLQGRIPSIARLTALTQFYAYSNQLTGSIPSLATNTALTVFYVGSNQLTDYAGGLGSRVLTNFDASSNALTEAAVNAILADLVVAQAGGNPVCVVHLEGGTNAAPTGQGLIDKATLIAAGWTVVVNP